MKISIVTVSYNSVETIKDTILSVLSQQGVDLEYIIIDGGSIDGTVDVVTSFGNKISAFISEPDKGIYDAMNKGIGMATGDIIGILNSDDIYFDENVLSSVLKGFVSANCDILYGDLYYVKRLNTEKVVRKWISKSFTKGSFIYGWHPPHPVLFVKKQVYTHCGYFNLDFKIAADFEFMLRLFEKCNLNSFYLNKPLVKMRLGGTTNKTIRNFIKQYRECYKAFEINNIKVSIFYFLFRYLPKFLQFLQ